MKPRPKCKDEHFAALLLQGKDVNKKQECLKTHFKSMGMEKLHLYDYSQYKY